ncbi:MAG: homoserine kinase type II [Candidatus Tokpelaia sp. JSC085]|nr:MAG: homoserine kinase type II [Candidatus Tokpelaia sp. JSC085]
MAVYTDVNENEIEDFLSYYNLAPLLSYKGIAEGVENSNFLLQVQDGFYILTLYEKRVSESDLPFFLGLMQFLAEKGITCPRPVRRQDGTFVGSLAGRPATIMTFLDGMWMRKPAVVHCRGVGKMLAKIHLASAGFPIKRQNSLSLADVRFLWNACRTRANEFSGGLKIEIDKELDFLEDMWPTNLPTGIIHADLFPDNVFFLGEQVSGLIDFYFSCSDAFAYDVAICLNAWCFEKDLSYNLTKSQALLSAYCNERFLNESELVTLPLLARGAAMRFFMTRLYDWFYIPDDRLVVKKDPREYLRKIRFFQQIRTVSELGISRDISTEAS